MEFTIYISKSVFWFAAGVAACIIGQILWRKFIVPWYIYCVEMIQRKRDEKCSEVIEAGYFTKPETMSADEYETLDEHLTRKKKVKKTRR